MAAYVHIITEYAESNRVGCVADTVVRVIDSIECCRFNFPRTVWQETGIFVSQNIYLYVDRGLFLCCASTYLIYSVPSTCTHQGSFFVLVYKSRYYNRFSIVCEYKSEQLFFTICQFSFGTVRTIQVEYLLYALMYIIHKSRMTYLITYTTIT